MNPPYIFIFLFDKRHMGKGIYPLASKNSYLNTDLLDLNGNINDKLPLIQLGEISNDDNTAFEIAFNNLPTEIPIVATLICSGMWFIYGFVYRDRKYGFIYGIRFDGDTHKLICIEGVISHT